MKRIAVYACMWVFCVVGVTRVQAQSAGSPNVLSELWNFEDAVTVPAGQVDLRLTSRWITASAPANRGDSNDDFVLSPSIVWGVADNLELSASVPIWLGDSGDRPGGVDGNADAYLGGLWRFAEPDGVWPAMALSGTLRIPTGDNSSGVDAELRLVMTKDYDNGMRSHVNSFVATINGDVDAAGDERNFQWGMVLGMDGPLCSDGAVRWVADYMHRSSLHDGASNINMLELGWEWKIADAQSLGLGVQVGLDDNEDTANVGIGVTYSYTLMN